MSGNETRRIAKVIGVMVVGALAAGCAHVPPAGWLPPRNASAIDTYGSWTVVKHGEAGAYEKSSGELIAVGPEELVLLPPSGELVLVPRDSVHAARVTEFQWNYTWSVIGVATTGSHGYFAGISAPLWVFGGGTVHELEPLWRVGSEDLEQLERVARFPAGVPEGLALSSLEPKVAGEARWGLFDVGEDGSRWPRTHFTAGPETTLHRDHGKLGFPSFTDRYPRLDHYGFPPTGVLRPFVELSHDVLPKLRLGARGTIACERQTDADLFVAYVFRNPDARTASPFEATIGGIGGVVHGKVTPPDEWEMGLVMDLEGGGSFLLWSARGGVRGTVDYFVSRHLSVTAGLTGWQAVVVAPEGLAGVGFYSIDMRLGARGQF